LAGLLQRLSARTTPSASNPRYPSSCNINPSAKGTGLIQTFVNGSKGLRFQKILHLDRFRLLRQEAFFKAVTVDPGGYGVSWNDEMDLSEYELWNNGVEVDR
jgi:hypothetical protein